MCGGSGGGKGGGGGGSMSGVSPEDAAKYLRWAGANDGFIDGGKTYRVYHGTSQNEAAKIKTEGLIAPRGASKEWKTVTTDVSVAKHYAEAARKPNVKKAVIEFRIPSSELKSVLWKGVPVHGPNEPHNVQHGLQRGNIPSKYIHSIKKI